MTLDELIQTLRMAAVNENTITAMTNAYNLGLEAGHAAQPEQEPVAIIHRNEFNEYRLEPHDNFDIKSIPFNVDVPLFKAAA